LPALKALTTVVAVTRADEEGPLVTSMLTTLATVRQAAQKL
jgi:hypothetical protein